MHYKKNKDKVLRYQKEYYKNNSEKIKKYSSEWGKMREVRLRDLGLCIKCGKLPIHTTSKNYCIQCLDKSNKSVRAYRNKNPDLVYQRQKITQSKKPELYKAIKRKYSLTHKDEHAQLVRARRVRIKQSGGSFTRTEWRDLLAKYDYKCLCCGLEEGLQADHVVPIIKGGLGSIDNIQPLCWPCNRWKWTKIIDFRPFGNIILEWT